MSGCDEMTDRTALSKRIRFEVFKRDQFSCQYCGRHPPDVVLEIDHIIPICDGGDASEGNLLTACFDCNRGKAGISLTSIPKTLAEQAAEIIEREQQLAAYREIIEIQKDRIDEDMWDIAEILFGKYECEKGIRRDWLASIKRFNKKLDLEQVREAAEIAYGVRLSADESIYSTHKQRRFAYFCGICWRKIRGESDPEDTP